MFHVGQKVVCVNADFTWGFEGPKGKVVPPCLPVLRGIYVVSGFAEADRFGAEQLFLEEFPDPSEEDRISFAKERFRPLAEHKTDIAVFRALLNPVNHKELA